jgi:hypothetical protein
MSFPGWESVDTVTKIHNTARAVGIVLLIVGALVTVCSVLSGVIAYVYGNQKDFLTAADVAREKEKAKSRFDKIEATIAAPVETGTLMLEVHDKYTGAALPHVSCLIDGRTMHHGQKLDFRVGKYSAMCIHEGYFDETKEAEIREGEATTAAFKMERTTGSIALTVTGSDGRHSPFTSIFVNGEEHPHITYEIIVVPNLPARTRARVSSPGTSQTITLDGGRGSTKRIEWGPVDMEVAVRGGIETPAKVVFPVLVRDEVEAK